MSEIRRKVRRIVTKETLVLSFSAGKTYSECPGRYNKQYIVREKSPEDKDETGTVPGNVVDRIARHFFYRVRHGYGDSKFMFDPDSKAFKEQLDEFLEAPHIYLGEGTFAEDEEEARQVIGTMSLNLADMISKENLFKDKEIILSEDNKGTTEFGTYKEPLEVNDWLRLSGAFDLFVSKNKETAGRLVDYKASNSDRYINPHQLKLYQFALKKKWGLKTAMAGFMLFNLNRTIWNRFDDAAVDETIDKFTRIAKSIIAEEFDLTPSTSSCRLCPYRTECSESMWVEDDKPKKKKIKVKAEMPEALNIVPEL